MDAASLAAPTRSDEAVPPLGLPALLVGVGTAVAAVSTLRDAAQRPDASDDDRLDDVSMIELPDFVRRVPSNPPPARVSSLSGLGTLRARPETA